MLATAIGLLAAIPAVIAYNKFSADAAKLSGRMEGFADEFSGILSRQLDERQQMQAQQQAQQPVQQAPRQNIHPHAQSSGM